MLISEITADPIATMCHPTITHRPAAARTKHSSCRRRRHTATMWPPVLITLMLTLDAGFAFNLSPRPNLVLREPDLAGALPKVRSSYFGFTLSLRTDSVIVGAPRAQSSLEKQRNINETGAIYRCPVDTTGACEPYVFEAQGNIPEKKNWREANFMGEQRNNQWLGAAMDGGARNSDAFVVCAPRMYTSKSGSKSSKNVDDQRDMHLNHGICYLTPNTAANVPADVAKLNGLNVKSQQHINGNTSTFFHMLGEQGLSVNIADDGSAVLMGAPGVHTWKGSVVLYGPEPDDGDSHGGAVRRRRDVSTDAVVQRHRRQAVKVNELYLPIVPNPDFWQQEDYSYLGYAVSSGRFSSQLMYVASAPRANLLHGEVYIFLVEPTSVSNNWQLAINQTLRGTQIGEYFGYALVSEDFNRDQQSDLAVAAPLHRWDEDSYDQGAVYIYKNTENRLELQSTLRSESSTNGRFGTTLARIGDLNGDGFMDLAVAAPFEEQGAVYIYLGSATGLISKASQRIRAPSTNAAQMMFGHGLSKGSDIDRNNYLDLAVGAPNAEMVYVYKSYPVVSVVASLRLNTYELRTRENMLSLTACWKMASRYSMDHEPRFKANITLDPKFDRVRFNKAKLIPINDTITENEKCQVFDVEVAYEVKYVFHPVVFEMAYEIVDQVPDTEAFCASCVAVNPTDAKTVQALAVFNTGCKSSTCITDLKVTSSIGDGYKFVLGSTKKLAIVYKVTNRGESSYLTQLNVSTVGTITFSRTPPECHFDHGAMLCDLHKEGAIQTGGSSELRIELDVSQASGRFFEIRAQANSVSNTTNPDNLLVLTIPLTESSEVHILGRSTLTQVSLEEGLFVKNIIHTFEVTNRGPSSIKQTEVSVLIPTHFRTPYTEIKIPVIDSSQLKITCLYDNQHYLPEYLSSRLLPRSLDEADAFRRLSINGGYDHSIGIDQVSGGVLGEPSLDDFVQSRRRRRQVSANHHIHARASDVDPYTPNLDEFDTFVRSLPVNRTVYMACNDKDNECVEARFRVNNFRAGNQPIVIALNFSIDLGQMAPLLNDEKDILVLVSTASVKKIGDDLFGLNTFTVAGTKPYTVISKYPVTSIIWIIIVSIVCGILLLTLVVYTMYRYGFFKRAKKEELEQFKRQSQALALQQSAESTDDD